MAKFTMKKEYWLWIIGILFVMSIMPGEGTKASSQQALVESNYICTSDSQCPKCVGGGIISINESNTDPGFLEELSYGKCIEGKCQLSDACLIWDCPVGSDATCKSVKQTLLDNTIGRMNDNPISLFGLIGLAVALLLLK